MNKAITHYLKQAFLLALTAILGQSCTRKADYAERRRHHQVALITLRQFLSK